MQNQTIRRLRGLWGKVINNPNSNEAAVAYTKFCELLEKNNLTIQDIVTASTPYYAGLSIMFWWEEDLLSLAYAQVVPQADRRKLMVNGTGTIFLYLNEHQLYEVLKRFREHSDVFASIISDQLSNYINNQRIKT